MLCKLAILTRLGGAVSQPGRGRGDTLSDGGSFFYVMSWVGKGAVNLVEKFFISKPSFLE